MYKLTPKLVDSNPKCFPTYIQCYTCMDIVWTLLYVKKIVMHNFFYFTFLYTASWRFGFCNNLQVILFRHLGLELEQSVGERYLSIPPSGEYMNFFFFYFTLSSENRSSRLISKASISCPCYSKREGVERTRHRTGKDMTGQDRTGQDRTGQDRTGQDRTGQDRTG